MEETPLVKAIHELLHESAINDTDDRYKKIIAYVCAKLELLTQYEKERERYIAERALDNGIGIGRRALIGAPYYPSSEEYIK